MVVVDNIIKPHAEDAVENDPADSKVVGAEVRQVDLQEDVKFLCEEGDAGVCGGDCCCISDEGVQVFGETGFQCLCAKLSDRLRVSSSGLGQCGTIR